MPFRFVESPNVTRTDGRSIDVVVIHTMEIAEYGGAAEACARWFASPRSQVSAHYAVDSGEIVQSVREQDIAWHARGGNTTSIGVELAGFAGQGPSGWDDDYSWSVLERAAGLVADICGRHEVPIRRLRPADLVAGRRGLAGHVDVSRAYSRSDHWDPGPAFPWTRFLRLVRLAQGKAAESRAGALPH